MRIQKSLRLRQRDMITVQISRGMWPPAKFYEITKLAGHIVLLRPAYLSGGLQSHLTPKLLALQPWRLVNRESKRVELAWPLADNDNLLNGTHRIS